MSHEPVPRGDDERVPKRLRAALEFVQAPPANLDQVVGRARRRRARRLAGSLAVAAVLVAVGVGLPLTLFAPAREGQGMPNRPGAGPQPSPAGPAGLPAPQPGWVWHRDSVHRAAIQTPITWHFSPATGMGLAQPTPLFIAGTGSLAAGGECAPTGAIQAMPRNGALMWAIEYVGTAQDFNPYEFSPRSDQLNLGPAVSRECIGEPSHQLLFQKAGRFFQAEVLFGPAAPSSLRAAVVESLESFRPEPAAVSLAEQCRRQWIFCPEAAWAFQVINRVRLFHWGNTGSAIQVGPQDPKPDPSRKLDLWTTRGGPLPPAGFHRIAKADATIVYGDGRRLLWRVQGLNVWVQAEQASALPHGAVLAQLVRTSRALPVGS